MNTFRRALFFAFAVHLGAGLTLLGRGPTAQGQVLRHTALKTTPKPATPQPTSSTSAFAPYDATWCALLAYEPATDSFKCAGHDGRIIPTQQGDMPICDFLLHDEASDGFRCAEQAPDGKWRARVWYEGANGNDVSRPIPPKCFQDCPAASTASAAK